jgi:hypothetical protein
MKKIFLIPIVFLLISNICYSQDTTLNRVASFKNYGQNIHFYLKPQHEFIYKGELDTIKEQFNFIVSFKIDIKGNIVEYETDKKENIPIVVVNYIQKVIYLTSGNWYPEIKNCKVVKSDKIRCIVNIFPRDLFSYNSKLGRSFTLEDFKKGIINLNLNEPNTCFLYLNY